MNEKSISPSSIVAENKPQEFSTNTLYDDQSSSPLHMVAPASVRPRPRVVIVGAGFGGLSAAQQLGQKDVDVLVLDRKNYHGFWPLIYEVATAGLEPEAIAYPVRGILHRYASVSFHMTDVRGFDFARKQIITDGNIVHYDYLIVAAGSTNNYFGNDSLASQTFSLKDIDDAQRLRNHILSSFELAVRETNPVRRARLMTFVIVGGGPTGVELAGAFAELIRHVLHKDYPMLDVTEARVMLVEATDRLLSPFPPSLQKKAQAQLEIMGVEVKLQTAVESVENGMVVFKGGSCIASDTVVWTAGVRGSSIAELMHTPLQRGYRVPVQPTLNLAEWPDVFVVGDMAHLEQTPNGPSYPMVATVAIQQGKHAAHNVMARMRKKPMKKFRYFNKGKMATIGRRAAVVDAYGLRISGFVAWVMWLFVHLISLVGFRNRLLVLINWAYNYWTYDRGVRLITSKYSNEDWFFSELNRSLNSQKTEPKV